MKAIDSEWEYIESEEGAGILVKGTGVPICTAFNPSYKTLYPEIVIQHNLYLKLSHTGEKVLIRRRTEDEGEVWTSIVCSAKIMEYLEELEEEWRRRN